MKKFIGFVFLLSSLCALVDVCLAAEKKELLGDSDPSSSPLLLKPDGMQFPSLEGVDPGLVQYQKAQKENIEADYEHFLSEYNRFWIGSGQTPQLNYLDFLTGGLRFSVYAVDRIAGEILGTLRGALGGFPVLTFEEKEDKEGAGERAKEIIIRAFLATEIVRNLDIWGAYRSEDPRYEIEEPSLWVAMHRAAPVTQDQFYILSAISLAVREQLWNPDSTLEDLQNYVRNFWPGNLSLSDLAWRERVIAQYITPELVGWINEMESSFSIRKIQKEALEDFQAQRPGMVVTKLNHPELKEFFNPGEILVHYPSSGNGNQCGFFSTFFENRSDKRGSSARQEFFNFVSRNLENPFVARAFVDKVIDEKVVIEVMLGNAWDESAKGTQPLVSGSIEASFNKLLAPYETDLKDGGRYQNLKEKALHEILETLRQYLIEMKPVWRERYTEDDGGMNEKRSMVGLKFAARIREQIVPLVSYLFKVLGAEPFRGDIEKLQKALQVTFALNGTDGEVSDNPNVELTFRQKGDVVEPFRAGYLYSDPVDGLVMANQNLFAWVGDYVYNRNFYRRGATISGFKEFAQELVNRLDITDEERKERPGTLLALEGISRNIDEWIHMGVQEKDVDHTSLVESLVRQGHLDGALKTHADKIQKYINDFRKLLTWWKQAIPRISGPEGQLLLGEIVEINSQMEGLILQKDWEGLGVKFAEGLSKIPVPYEDEAQKQREMQKWGKNLIQVIRSFRDALSDEGKKTLDLDQITMPFEKRQELSTSIYKTVLRKQQLVDHSYDDSELDNAFLTIMELDRSERPKALDSLGLDALIIKATQAVHYPEGKDIEKDRGSAVWWLNQLRRNLLTYPVPLAVAESGGSRYYLLDAILATTPEGKNTARNTHLINFSGGHYEKLIPTSARSLTSVAKAMRHMTKYSDTLFDGGTRLAAQSALSKPKKEVVEDDDDEDAAIALSLELSKLASSSSNESESAS